MIAYEALQLTAATDATTMNSKYVDQETIDARRLLRDAGLKCTSARLAVMERLGQATSPLTHAELAAELVPRGFDKATVFRNLIDLTEAEIVSRSELGDHVWRFELRDPAERNSGGHPHFVCVDCGSVTCLSDVEFDSATKKRAAQLGRVTEILLKGHCLDCV
jgi:Fur family ferric uptake transcriptional regulator